jgi:hypothetical protein
LNRTTAQKRIHSALQRYSDERPGLAFLPAGADLGDWAPRRTRRWRLAQLRTPVSQREWLSLGEAATYLDTPRRTIHDWH